MSAEPTCSAVDRCWSLARACWSLVAVLSLGGCHCCCCTDHVSCLVDWGIDHAVPFDGLYCSKLDLTRLGRCDGLQCCCRDCPPIPCYQGAVYAHRWNSPPTVTPDPGMQGPPELPPPDYSPPVRAPAELGPPPGAVHVEPLFPVPEQRRAEEGVVQTGYVPSGRVQTRDVPNGYNREIDTGRQWLVPTSVLFGN